MILVIAVKVPALRGKFRSVIKNHSLYSVPGKKTSSPSKLGNGKINATEVLVRRFRLLVGKILISKRTNPSLKHALRPAQNTIEVGEIVLLAPTKRLSSKR